MLLTNAFISDPRVENEAKALIEGGYKVTLFAWDREKKTAEPRSFGFGRQLKSTRAF